MKGLKAIRQKRGLSQADLEKMTGIDANTFSRYERGIVTPSVEVADKIAKALGVSIDSLIKEKYDEGKIKITISYDWEKYEKGEIDMSGNAFELNLGRFGTVGLHGAGDFKSLQDIDDFLTRAREQLVIALEAQQKRGAIQPA